MQRIGFGYDAHRFEKDRELIIGGVNIPFEFGLSGHSDADVLLHAVADSLLGGAALGDIGKLFPDTDEKYKDISSLTLLKKVAKFIFENGYSIANVDATIVAETPRMRSFIDEMRRNISDALLCDIDRVSVKATTEEGMGFTGKKEGIA
ncbi:MAG TPA: 2-C-methyl-D-erythritol 2,4-cyclodiphosphate synthase, partial [Clostridia bacterium]|nr:2-C-methyl-D-erythritol 2,4-cyclodiphosphate synthase [Clostridia bacterium]